jgi:HSP20 family molecular chaperone IbpA
MPLGRATRTGPCVTSPSRTVDELRRDLEHLVADLFESDRCGAIPALDVNRRDGQLVVYARLPGSDQGDASMGLEVRLPCGLG